ncbi:hypothetical protein ACWET9_48105 [Streptomyces sp. NPDC004059]
MQESALLARREQLEQRHASLIERRQALLPDVDRAQRDLIQAEQHEQAAAMRNLPAPAESADQDAGEYARRLERVTPPGIEGGGAYPPRPAQAPATAKAPSRRFILLLAAAVVTVVALGGILIVTLDRDSDQPQAKGNTPQPVRTVTASAPSSPAGTDSSATDAAAKPAEYTDAPFTLRGANLHTCDSGTSVTFAGSHPTVSSGTFLPFEAMGNSAELADLFYLDCKIQQPTDQPFIKFPDNDPVAHVTSPPTDADSCQAAAEQNPTANLINFSQLKSGDKFCLETSTVNTPAHVVYLQVVTTDRTTHDVHWKATSWTLPGTDEGNG